MGETQDLSAESPRCSQCATEEEHRAAERRVWKRQIRVACWLNIITLGGVIGAFVGLLFVYLGLVEAKRASDIANISMIASNRAWLTPVSAQQSAAHGQSLHFSIIYGNTGREAATGFGAQEQIGIVDLLPPRTSLYTVFKKEMLEDVCGRTGASPDGLVVYPSTGTRDYTYSVETDPIPEIENGTKMGFIHGCFAYFTFGATKKSEYCFLFEPTAPNEFRTVNCPYGNKAY